MAANMYAKSIFGENVLANLSIEKPAHLSKDSPVQGHIRIRAKSQVNPTLNSSCNIWTTRVEALTTRIECVCTNDDNRCLCICIDTDSYRRLFNSNFGWQMKRANDDNF